MLTVMAAAADQAYQMDVHCCAMELEQEIVRLEAAANKGELVSFSLLLNSAPNTQHTVVHTDDAVQGQDVHMSAADSEDGTDDDQPDDAEMVRIRANAQLVGQCGKTLQAGAWRGCVKSPWCDREDRHRGLCNHKATIPGPAAFPESESGDEEEQEHAGDTHNNQQRDQDDDASNLDEGGYEACSHDVVMQGADDEQVSGGHSHTCGLLEACTSGDEREVASPLQTGVIAGELLQGVQPQHSTTQAQLQEQVAAASMDVPMRSSSTAEEDLFWCSAGQLAAAELFSIPPAYQPRVKDLTAAPGAPCLLGMDSLCDISTPLTSAPPAEEPQATGGSMSSECSDHTVAKPCGANSGTSSSVPSSPSCASMDAGAAVFGPFQPAPVSASPDATPTSAAAVCDDSQAASSSPAESAATPVQAPAAAAEQARAVSPVPAEKPAAATTLSAVAAPADSAKAALEQAAAEAAAAEVVAAAAAAAAAEAVAAAEAAEAAVVNNSTNSSSPSAATPVAAAAAAAAAKGSSGLAGVQRPPRIKSKPSNSVMKAAAAVEASSGSSPTKGKKRPAARLATNPTSHHSCTQCGAVSTPVWRAGPAGPKTLCNACGVRYMKVAKRKP